VFLSGKSQNKRPAW